MAEFEMLDLRNVSVVQIELKKGVTGADTLWVNVDGKCALRIVLVKTVTFTNERDGETSESKLLKETYGNEV